MSTEGCLEPGGGDLIVDLNLHACLILGTPILKLHEASLNQIGLSEAPTPENPTSKGTQNGEEKNAVKFHHPNRK